MDEFDRTQELLDFFRALSDINRLKIVSLLAQQELSVEQLAEMLHLRSSTVSHHLARLVASGLVSARPQSYYNLYRLEPKRLEELSQRLLASETLPEVAADVDMDAYDRKVFEAYVLPDGRLKQIPVQLKKLLVILRYLNDDFEVDVRYSEKQVNEIIGRHHADFVSLRRELIDRRFLGRNKDGSEYWKIVEEGD